VEKFGADATRLALADAGDGIEDANFDEKNANASILRLHTLVEWCQDMKAEIDNPNSDLRRGEKDSFHDAVIENEIYRLNVLTKAAYEATNYKEALKEGFFEMQSSRDWYREVTFDIGMHGSLVELWIRSAALLVLPIAPHFSEHVWSGILGEKRSVQWALWPGIGEKGVEDAAIEAGAYLRGTVKMIRDAEITLQKKALKGKGGSAAFDAKKAKALRIFVATRFPEWQDSSVQVVKEIYEENHGTIDDGKIRDALVLKGLMKDKRIMPFVQNLKKRIGQFGASVAFKRTLPFNERETLEVAMPYLKRTLGVVSGEVFTQEEGRALVAANAEATWKSAGGAVEASEPGQPGIQMWNP